MSSDVFKVQDQRIDVAAAPVQVIASQSLVSSALNAGPPHDGVLSITVIAELTSVVVPPLLTINPLISHAATFAEPVCFATNKPLKACAPPDGITGMLTDEAALP